ncbi:MAG: NADH-quinone oxidoreductase subunit L [Deltaproteobacteria bacterium]|nr:NADH-quinone oxidoreductase subunit L [Deltaproteobacteria bacterium]
MLGLILALPLVGFLINGLFGRKFCAKTSGIIASAAIFGSFVITLTKFFQLSGMEENSRVIEETLFQWISAGDLSVPFVLRFDPLTAIMCSVITGVGFLIHVYSIGYMAHDRTPPKFFAYLNLFSFAMLALVLGGNLPILFLGWEGVGLCSYLLIGYWYEDDAKASAGKKAFIVNRIGDLGFLVGIFLLFGMFKTVDFAALKSGVAANSAGLDIRLLTIATMCLFVGAMGKSAQFPLYVWLPDAMAGPTPVSALIHAATMVTAGVYMIARMNFIFALTPHTLMLISGVGAFTAIFAATIALTKRDIKKVLAYSTVSQLGFMFVAVGVGAFTAGVFHLMTHAFFKALLFLGSGSVIHGMHEEQDIMKMGGLRKYMPKTFATFVVGTAAISGFPLLSGFFSKDEILWSAFSSHLGLAGFGLWAIMAFTALLTAFYMTRLTCLTFLGEPRFDPKKIGAAHAAAKDHGHGHGDDDHEHEEHHAKPGVHESPGIMVIPLIVLAVLSVIGGYVGIPHYSAIEHWLVPVVGEPGGEASSMMWVLMAASVAIGLLGIGLGYYLYVLRTDIPKSIYENFSAIYKILFNKYYVDEIYDALIVRPIKQISMVCWKVLDVIIVDGTVLAFARVSRFTGEVSRLVQTGAIQVYAVFILLGLTATMGYLIYGH